MSDSLAPFSDWILRGVLDAAAVGVWTWDVATQSVRWSVALERLLGMAPGAFKGTFEAYLAILHPDDREHVTASISASLASGDSYEVEHRVIVQDTIRWVTCRGQPAVDEIGKITGMRGVVWDVTARKNAEAHAARLYRLSNVVGAINKEILRVSSEGELFERACRIAVEIGGVHRAWIDLVEDGGDSGPRCASVQAGQLEAGASQAPDLAGEQASFPLWRGGRVIGALGIHTGTSGRFDDEEIALLGGLANDMSFALDALARDEDRRTAHEALGQSEVRYRSLVEQATDAIFLTDEDLRFVDVNGAACKMLGYSRGELLGLSIVDVLAPGELEVRPVPSEVAGSTWTIERRMRTKDGRTLVTEVCAKVLPPRRRIQAFVRDIGERKELQAQLLMADRLASLGRLAGGVAHEINNPLAYVAMNLELAEQEVAKLPPSPEATHLARVLAESRGGAERVRRIVRGLGAFGRGDDEPVTSADVHRSLDAAVSIADNRIRHRARLVRRYGATRCVRANELLLGQVFVNLLVNAADAIPEGRIDDHEIRLSTSVAPDGRVVVEIGDTGMGMSPEVRARVFDPFFSTKPIGMGTGLGLSICHSIIQRFGGEIELNGALGHGTTARVVLLASDEAAVTQERSPASVRSAGARILVVDDELAFARVLGEALDYHDVTVLGSARAARMLCANQSFDCILCDLMMPDLDGPGFYEALQADGRGLEKRIVFMTGGAFTPRARQFLSSIPNVCVDKPLSIRSVEEVVREMVTGI